jgi:hypothetical protein
MIIITNIYICQVTQEKDLCGKPVLFEGKNHGTN